MEIALQEKNISQMQTLFAEQILDYLASGKFLNFDLYEWMSSIIESIYSFFLQQATSVARLAEKQLTFERQERLPEIIKMDYWTPVLDNQGFFTTVKLEDMRGLTGSVRLLRDIYDLDQYAFNTNQRKLQLAETFSLFQLDPSAFKMFMNSGVLLFETPMKLFDSKFPGHYLRLIRRVRLSVVALIPPTVGIRATLSNIGSSNVVLGPDNFETVDIRRDPESISFTSPFNATGLFELDTQPELLVPFEGLGVDTRWQLEMPKASNPFDFATIADVLFTIEYTALNSYDYKQQVIKRLPKELAADRAYSFRNNFPDEWYDFNNPDQTETPMVVNIITDKSDFPPNINSDTLSITHITLCFVKSDNADFNPALSVTFQTTELDQVGNPAALGGQAITKNGILSTRSGNAAAWNSVIGKSPARTWTLTLPNDDTTIKLFKEEKIKDILLVLSYSGQLYDWPV